MAAVPSLLAGCVANTYELELTVEDETLHRRLVCSREAGRQDPPNLHPMPDGELERIAAAYGVETPENAARKFVFRGEFTGRTPDDVGGAGTLAMYESDLGRTWTYVERFRGQDDLTTTLAKREEAVDQFVDAVTAWLHGELGDGDGGGGEFERVREFIDSALRRDLHNVAAYALLARALEETAGAGPDLSEIEIEMLVRVGQLGLERGYLSPADVPALVQVAKGSDAAALLSLLRTILATKLGPDVDVAGWRFLDSPERVVASINGRLADFPPYQTSLAEWSAARDNPDPAEAPKPSDWLGGLVLRFLGIDLGGSDALRVRLHCPQRPFHTNGDWSERGGVVSWDTRLTPRTADPQSSPSVLPAVLFAFWSVPDDVFQTEHFGRVILRDDRLAQYVMWRASLPEAEAAEWERFISGLRPSTILSGRVKVFRFTSDPPDGGEGTALSERGRELILSGLDDPS